MSAALFGKTRRGVLSLLYGRPDQSFHVREIARAVGTGQGAVQRELLRLSDAGILLRVRHAARVEYRADPECPIFGELQSLIVKTSGVLEVLEAALSPLEDDVVAAFVYGSIASGSAVRRSDLDLLVIGRASFRAVLAALRPAEERLGREINAMVLTAREYGQRAAAGDHFLGSVHREPKIFVLGTERELEGLGRQRVAERASHE